LQPFLTFYFILTGHGSLPSISDMMEDIEIKRDHNNLYMKSQRHTIQVSTSSLFLTKNKRLT